MHVCGRRFDIGYLIYHQYDHGYIEENLKLYRFVEVSDKNVLEYIDMHTDFIVLKIFDFYQKSFISKFARDFLLDKVEGYYFGYQENLIDAKQLYDKLDSEVLPYLNMKTNGLIGVFDDLY